MKTGRDQSQIAKLLRRHKSTISGELRRNADYWGYRPRQAVCATAERSQHSRNANTVVL